MKGIVSLYVETYRELGITTIQQAKKITRDEYSSFQIRPEHQNWRYALLALKHINETTTKTSSKAEPSRRESSLEQYRQGMIADLTKRIEQLPDGDRFKACLVKTRKDIEEQISPATGMA